jgi:hypothetical protein
MNGKWHVDDDLDTLLFDFSWVPEQQHYYQIHQFGTQHSITGGPAYITEAESGVRYYSRTVKKLPDPHNPNWELLCSLPPIFSFDYSWHPYSDLPIKYLFPGHNCDEPVIAYNNYEPGEDYQIQHMLDFRAGVYKKGTEWLALPYTAKDFSIPPDLAYDIVFISNNEPNAEDNWEHLCNITYDKPNRLHRIDGINGRVAAYHAAAQASTTPYFFAVFAKLTVDSNFDFGYHPPRQHFDRHIIFHATNPVNGLVYGHQAMILYNKRLVLDNCGNGLDFTLDQIHEVEPINSGVANYNCDDWTEWRTTFREVIKLAAQTDDESMERLATWIHDSGDSMTAVAALHALEYYREHKNQPKLLKLTYEWSFLRDYYTRLTENKE